MEDGDLRPYLEVAERLIEPVAVAIETPEAAASLLEDLGYISDTQVTAFTELGGGVDMIVDAIGALVDAIEADDEDAALLALGELLLGVGRVFAVIKDFAAKIQANFAGSDILTQTDIIAEIPRKLADYLVVKLVEDHYPKTFASLMLLGAIEIEQVDDTPTSFHAQYLKRVVNWEEIPDKLGDPFKAIDDTLSDADEFAYELLLYLVREFAVALGLPVTYDVPQDGPLAALNDGDDLTQLDNFDELTMLRFLLVSDPAAELGIELYPRIDTATKKRTGLGAGVRFGSDIEIPLGDAFKLVLKIAASLMDSLGVVFKKGQGVQFVNKLFTSTPEQLAESVQIGVTASIMTVDGQSSDRKLTTLGLPLGRLEIGSGELTLGVEKQAAFRVFAEADLSGGVLEIGTGNADGFIASILPEGGIRSEFSVGIGVSSNAGLYFKGTSGLTIRVPLHLALGPIGIDYITLGAEFKDKEIPLIAATGLSANVGPLAAAVEDIGVKATIKPHADSAGNAGPLELAFGFKPPKGVGLRVDAGVVIGGGYVFLDPDAGEYAGVLELTVADWLSLKAIGLITTKMPDGSNGFSLLVIITAEFGTGLQLGYGFVLIGVGGLVGLHRTMKLQPLMEGVRTGAVNGIMFPVDPVANAPRIISDLKAIFPPQQNVFLIGPMAKLGWTSLISISLGVIIEIPGNIAILGVLGLIVPTEDEPVLTVQVNFAGAIEFDKKRVYFFAALFDSHVLTMTLEGEMAVLAAFGDDPNFVLSVGGFHPSFTPPPLPVPTPKRLALTILNESQAKLRAETYFAVTTNTVQFGAKLEAFFGFDSFSLEGNLAFDALFRFSPFHLVAEFSASFSAKVAGVGLFSVRSHFTLEGPTPWRAHGTGSISLLFFDIDVGFDKTWGAEQDTTLPPIAVMPLLEQEFEKPANWRALVPAANRLLVSLRQLDPAANELVLHPLGTLRVSQRAVPLDLTIDKLGTQKPSDAKRFVVSVAAGPLAKQADVDESFAPAQFKDMSDAEKLSRPAFEPGHGGFDLSPSGAQLATGTSIKRGVRYELTTIDTYFRRFTHPFKRFPGSLWEHFLDGASVARSRHSQFEEKLRNPFDDRITAGDETYVVAFQSNNRPYAGDQSKFSSESMARDHLARSVGEDPTLDGELHVIPEFETAAA